MTAIITGKKQNKKYYDKQGNLITDETLLADVERGENVISYNEQSPGPVKETQYDKNTKRLIRSRKRYGT